MLTEHIGLLSPTSRCSAYAASGSLKRMASSETMSVPEIVTFVDGLRPILRHFKLSGKSTAALNDALELLANKINDLVPNQNGKSAGLLCEDCSFVGTFVTL